MKTFILFTALCTFSFTGYAQTMSNKSIDEKLENVRENGLNVKTELNAKERKTLKIRLMKEKNIPTKNKSLEVADNMVAELSPWECSALGGTIVYHDGCGDIPLKCVPRGADSWELCITEMKSD